MTYTVTDSRQLSSMTQAGGERKFYRVWITTARGATGSVDVPVAQWNKDTLSEILTAKAAELDLAFSLNE